MASIFLDIKTAYASVQRSLFIEDVGNSEDDHRNAYLAKLLDLGFSASDADEIYEDVCQMH